MSPIDFQVTRSKVKDKTAGLLKHVGCSLSPDPYAGKLLNVVQWMPLESRWPILMSRSWSKSNCWFLKQICLLNISWLLCWKVAKLGIVNALWFQLMFNSHGLRSCSNCWSLNKCPLNIFWLPCLKFPKHRTVDATKKEMFPIDFLVTLSKVKVKLLIFEKWLSAQYLKLYCLIVSKFGTVVAHRK